MKNVIKNKIKMISTQHLSKNGKNWITKKPSGNKSILNKDIREDLIEI